MAQDPARPNVPPNMPAAQGATGAHPSGTYFLGRYRIVDEIGVGGMASVHLARIDGAGGFQKWIAIKRIHPHLVEDESFIQMFLDEARVAARISHPNVATVFELGKEADSFWIAMEYLHGEPLREIMRRTEELGTPMPPEIACRIIADAAEGLHAAHELLGKNGEKLNLVHRDVTPHNLFVTYDGATKVVDFGIAKFSSRMASTRAGTLKGKLAYMSPEQVAGENIDRRTDIFALGVVLWELTTGQRLFRMDSDLDTLAKVQDCNVPKPTTLIRGYPVELERVVLKALAKNKNDRYRTAREFSRALQSMLMKRGLFISSEEVAAYIRSIFGDRIEKREAHLRWAAELAQTGENPAVPKAAIPDFEGSVQSYDSNVQAKQPQPVAPKPAFNPAATLPLNQPVNPSSTLPIGARSGGPPGVPRPAAGMPARPPQVAPAPQAAPPPMADLDSMEDDGPTIMAPTPMEEEYDDNDKTQIQTKPDAPPTSAQRIPAIRPAAGMPAPAQSSGMGDEFDATRAQPQPPMNAAMAVPPRPAPARGTDPALAPPVMVQQPPNMAPPGFSPAAFAPTYAPQDPRMMPPAFPNAPPHQGPTMLVGGGRSGVPMWVVGAVSGLAALMVLLVVYLLAVPPHPTPAPSTGTVATPTMGANGPFGAARAAFSAAITPSAAPVPTTTATAIPTAMPTPSATATATAAATDTATAAPTATATATATAAATHVGPTQLPTPSAEKGFLTLVTLPRCDAWTDNGSPMGSCPIVNKALSVGSHRITVSTKAPATSKTLTVIIQAGQINNPPLVMLQ